MKLSLLTVAASHFLATLLGGATVALALALSGCAANVDESFFETAQPLECPATQHAVVGSNGKQHCVIPHDFVNVVSACKPERCFFYTDWAYHGDGGNGAIYCAAACEAFCTDAPGNEAESVTLAAREGLECAYK